jgi:tRNA dimethylallyltransferase
MVQSIYYIISVTVTPMALRPLVAIFGTTGVGKSKLAIELALALSITKKHGWQGARIINADSMQVYAGMDIITNKVPQSERQGVEHLLMGFKQPGEQYIVGEWVNDALKAVSDYDIFASYSITSSLFVD